MRAVIRTGGKQYLISPGQKVRIEKIDKKEGDKIGFPDVLLLEKEGKIVVGKPIVKGVKVEGKVLAQKKGKKITILKYKPKTRYKVKKGHRQPFTEVEIKTINYKP